jgi:hypothetical protein
MIIREGWPVHLRIDEEGITASEDTKNLPKRHFVPLFEA